MSDFAQARFPMLAPQERPRAHKIITTLQSLPLGELWLLATIGLALILTV